MDFQGATLNLTDIQRNDRGNYICVADNNVKPPDSFKVEVIVFFKPSCRPVQSTVGQAQNRRFNAKLECIVAGMKKYFMSNGIYVQNMHIHIYMYKICIFTYICAKYAYSHNCL